jgi:PKD repeat protein
VADAGDNQSIVDADNSGDEEVTLDGSGSTDDGTIDSWSWSLNGIEFGTGETLTVGASVGVYTVVLTVTDEEGETDTDDVVITVVASGENVPPVAHAGQNQSIKDADDSGDEEVTLDGSGSTDSDGTITSMSWSENSVELGTGVTLTTVFDVGTHTVTLTVTDDGGATDTQDVTITVVPFDDNLPPVADAGEDRTVIDDDYDGYALVTLDGSGSTDADGTIVAWGWFEDNNQIAPPGETSEREFSIGRHQVELRVRDNEDVLDRDEVIITVQYPTLDGVVVFERDSFDQQFGGASLLRADIANLNDDIAGPCLPAGSNWDNCISSIRVTEGWTAILFDDFGFAGDSLVVTQSLPDLDSVGGADWDNRASSIKVRPPN